jgi:hypothetical protein
VIFYFLFNSFSINASEKYYVDYCIATGTYLNFSKAGYEGRFRLRLFDTKIVLETMHLIPYS